MKKLLVILMLGSLVGCENKPEEGDVRWHEGQLQAWDPMGVGAVVWGRIDDNLYSHPRLDKLEKQIDCLESGGHRFVLSDVGHHVFGSYKVVAGFYYTCSKCGKSKYKSVCEMTAEEWNATKTLMEAMKEK